MVQASEFLGGFFDPTPRGQNLSPAALEQARAYATALQKPSEPSPGPYGRYGPWNAAADSIRAALGGFQLYKLNNAEQAQRQQGAQDIAKAFSPFLPASQPVAPSSPSPSATPPQAEAGETNPNLAARRARFAQELDADPALRQHVLAISAGENLDPTANLSVIESAMNRASMMGTTLAEEMKHTSQGGYYAGYNPAALNDPAARAIMERNLQTALNGSNASRFATDNASGNFAAQRVANGMYAPNSAYGGESFLHPQGPDARGHDKYAAWLQSVASQPAGAPQGGPVRMASLNGAPVAPGGLPDQALSVPSQTYSPTGQQLSGPGMPAPGGMPAAGPTAGPGGMPTAGAPGPGGMPSAGAPSPMPAQAGPAAGAPGAGLPQPLTAPTGLTPQSLAQILSNPWLPDSAKSTVMQMVQSRMAPQTMDVEGGKLMYNMAGQRVFIPIPRISRMKIGDMEFDAVSHYDSQTGKWQTQPMAPGQQGAGGQPGGSPQPDLSSIGGMQQSIAAQAGAKGYSEAQGKSYAARMDNLQQTAMSAQNEVPQLQMLKQVINDPSFYSGFQAHNIAQMDSALKAAGLGTGQRSSLIQFATKLGAAGSLENIREMGQVGAVRVPEMQMIQQSNFAPELNQDAARAVTELRMRLAQRQIEIADKANDYADRNQGRIDRGFDKELKAYYRDKPLLTDAEIKGFHGLMNKPAPAGQPGQPGQAAPAAAYTEGDVASDGRGNTLVYRGGKWLPQ